VRLDLRDPDSRQNKQLVHVRAGPGRALPEQECGWQCWQGREEREGEDALGKLPWLCGIWPDGGEEEEDGRGWLKGVASPVTYLKLYTRFANILSAHLVEN